MRSFFKSLLKSHFSILYWWLRRFRYEKKVIPLEFMRHINRLSSSSLVIDVGANVGRISEVMAHRGARVISFEPNSKAFEELKNVEQRYPNVKSRNEAAGIKNQQIKLFLHKDMKNTDRDLTSASSLISHKYNVSRNNAESVNEIDFAQFLNSLEEPVELIKVDIEGYEIQLVNHLLDKKAIGKVNKFYIETHERKIDSLVIPTEKLKARIKKEGYEDKFFFEWN